MPHKKKPVRDSITIEIDGKWRIVRYDASPDDVIDEYKCITELWYLTSDTKQWVNDGPPRPYIRRLLYDLTTELLKERARRNKAEDKISSIMNTLFE